MCGIIGYTGKGDAPGIMLDALELLEYRGYDSAGIALLNEGKTQIVKCAGRVKDLRTLCAEGKPVGHCGIGHTRWATHGGVCDENAHPHKFYQGDPYSAIRRTVLKLKGTFALAIMFDDQPDQIFAVRNVSPIVAAIVPFTSDYFVMPEFHVVCLKPDGVEMFDLSGDKAEIEWQKVDWDVSVSA